MVLTLSEHHDPPDVVPCHPYAPMWADAVRSTYINCGRAQAHGQMLRLQAFFETDRQFNPDVAQRLSAIVEEAFLACEGVMALRVVDREHYAA